MSEKLKAYGNYKKCCVPDCKNKNSVRHRFPLKNDVRFKIWIKCIQNPILTELSKIEVYNNYRICSQHFEKKYILAGSKLLHRQAIPTLNVTGYSGENINDPSPAPEIPGLPTEKIVVYMPSSEVKDTTKYAFTAQQLEELPVVDQAVDAPLPATSFQRNICRTCLCKISASDSVEIFSDEQFYKGQTLIQVFKEITQTLVDPIERLPSNICLKCADKLKHTVAFKRNIQEADLALRRKLRLIEMRYHMKEIDSITSALDDLCSELVEIQDGFEISFENHANDESAITSMEAPKSSTPKRKPVDIKRLRALQRDIDSIVAGSNSPIFKSNRTRKITNETLNQVKEIAPNTCASNAIHIPINNNNNYNHKSTNTNLSNVSTTNNKNQNAQESKVAIFNGNEFTEKYSNQYKTAGMSLDMPKTYPEKHNTKNEKENRQQNYSVSVNEIIDSEMDDEIKIEDTEFSNNMYEKLQLAENKPVVTEMHDDEEGTCSSQKKGHNVEQETHNVGGENSNTEEKNHNPLQKNSNVRKESHLVNEYNTKMSMDVSEKPHACYKCDKRFTSANILQRHLLYHSLMLEPTDQPEKQDGNSMRGTMKDCQVFKRGEQIKEISKKTNSDLEQKQVINLSDGTYDHHIKLTHKQSGKELPVIYYKDRKKYFRRRYKCTVCQNGYANMRLVLRHVKSQHEAKFKCDHCDKTFNRKEPFIEHLIKSHGVRRTSLCYICGKMVNTVSMALHIKTHTTTKSIKCTFEGCSAVLKYERSLQNHIKLVHENEKPFICERCGKSLASKYSLRQHMHSHMKVFLYNCEICDKGFALRHVLKKHLLSHRNYKPYTCPVCPQVFSQKHSIKKHCVTFHPEHPLAKNVPHYLQPHYSVVNSIKKSFECTVCPRKFAYEYNLKKHNWKFHPVTYYKLKRAQLNNSVAVEEITSSGKDIPK